MSALSVDFEGQNTKFTLTKPQTEPISWFLILLNSWLAPCL